MVSSHLRLVLPSGLFPSEFLTKTLHTLLLSPIYATCPTHLFVLYFKTIVHLVGFLFIVDFSKLKLGVHPPLLVFILLTFQ
jgi:hypothetical protein